MAIQVQEITRRYLYNGVTLPDIPGMEPKEVRDVYSAQYKSERGPVPGSLLHEAQAAVASVDMQRVYGALLRRAHETRQVERGYRRARLAVPPSSLPPVA
jgi:hypothetical protein